MRTMLLCHYRDANRVALGFHDGSHVVIIECPSLADARTLQAACEAHATFATYQHWGDWVQVSLADRTLPLPFVAPLHTVEEPKSVYLLMGEDTCQSAKRFHSKAAALAEFVQTAHELAQYEQGIDGWLHYANNREELVDYPDAHLSLGPRGGLRITSV